MPSTGSGTARVAELTARPIKLFDRIRVRGEVGQPEAYQPFGRRERSHGGAETGDTFHTVELLDFAQGIKANSSVSSPPKLVTAHEVADVQMLLRDVKARHQAGRFSEGTGALGKAHRWPDDARRRCKSASMRSNCFCTAAMMRGSFTAQRDGAPCPW